MVKVQRRSKDRSIRHSAFAIVEQATENKNVKESLGENAELYFEDKSPQKNSKRLKAPRILRVDEILASKSRVSTPSSYFKKKSQGENSESKLLKRYAKSKRPLKPARTINDIWGTNCRKRIGKKIVAELESLTPQAMSYRPEPVNQLKILQSVELKEQAKLEKAEKFRREAEKIRNALVFGRIPSDGKEVPDETKEGVEGNSLISECGNESCLAASFVRPKTRKERSMEEKVEAKKQNQIDKKREKDFDKQFEQLPAIAKQVRRELNRTLTKTKLKRPTLISTEDIILPEQVPNTLREISTSGNLLNDVFKSLKKRAAIEGIKRKSHIPHKKIFTRHCYK